MQVLKLSGDYDRFRCLATEDDADWKWLRECFDGREMAIQWRGLRVVFFKDGLNENRPISDCPEFSPGIPVFSEAAINALRPVLETCGETLPLQCSIGRYHAFNVLRTVDALDEEKSRIRRFSNGSIMDVERYEFSSARVAGEEIFRLPQLAAIVFVTDLFKDRVEKAGLSGFKFSLLWEAKSGAGTSLSECLPE